MEPIGFYTMRENKNPKQSNETQEMPNDTPKNYSLHKYIKALAYIELFSGILLSFLLGFTEYSYISGYDFNGVIFFSCLIGAFVSFIFTLGFARIVEAADRYLKK